jgi:hypothetical protein
LSTPHPTPKLENYLLSAVCDCIFNIFAATLHIRVHSSICNLRTSHVFVTGTHLSWKYGINTGIIYYGNIMFEIYRIHVSGVVFA